MKISDRIKFYSVVIILGLMTVYLLFAFNVLPDVSKTLIVTPAICLIFYVFMFVLLLSVLIRSLYKKCGRRQTVFLIIGLFLIAFMIRATPLFFFAEVNYKAVLKYYDLEEARRGKEMPAGIGFPLDVDNSIDTETIASFYGASYVRQVLGSIIMENGQASNVIIIYQRDTYNPMRNVTIVKLSDDFNVQEQEYNQGYEFNVYPIEEILHSPIISTQ